MSENLRGGLTVQYFFKNKKHKKNKKTVKNAFFIEK